MRVSPTIAVVALTMGLVGACAPPLLAPDDRDHVCQAAVYEKFGSPVFHPNPLSRPTGGLAGAAGGALQGLVAVPNVYAWIITVPLGAVIGAVGGTACAAASQSHPYAEADFEKILKAADAGSLKRALEAELNAPRAGCGQAQADVSAATVPDTVIEIENVDIVMGCAFGKQGYWLGVKWRVIKTSDGRVLGEKTTRCRQESYRDVDDWFADSDQARMEIEGALTKTGRRMAKELATCGLSECRLLSSKTGEIEER